jgi:hypothetical protein
MIDEQIVLDFRRKAIAHLEPKLLSNGYERQKAAELAFFVAKILEDALPLIEDVNTDNENADEVMDDVHMLFTNKAAVEEAHSILMFEK